MKYGCNPITFLNYKNSPSEIDWKRVQDDGYWGIDITPYDHDLHFILFWYNPWDCASQAFWDYRAIKSIRLLHRSYDDTI